MLSKENILETLGAGAEEQIYLEYTGLRVEPNRYYINPFNSSQHKTFKVFVNSVGRLAFKDFSPQREHYRGDCFTAVMFATGKDFIDALKDIDSRFRLGLCEKVSYEPVIRHSTPFIPHEPKEPVEIDTVTQQLKPYDKAYWESFKIYTDILAWDGVFSCAYAKLNGNLWATSCRHMPLFVYKYPDGTSKIYSPKNYKRKWLGNCGKNTIDGLELLPKKGDKLVIASGKKDGLVFATHGYWKISFISEGVIPEGLEDVIARFDEVFVWLDNDDAGKKATQKLCETHKSLIPIYWEDYEKDIADYSRANPFSKTKQLLHAHLGPPSYVWKHGNANG